MRVRKCDDETEYERVIDDHITQGYDVKDRGQDSARLKKTTFGGLGAHLVILVLFGWWTVGVANGVYAAYKYWADSKEMQVKVVA